jgi:hypothetical protein
MRVACVKRRTRSRRTHNNCALMGKTTKGGKSLNPTDAFRKEQRKKELKKVQFNMFSLSHFNIDFTIMSTCHFECIGV